MDEHFHAMNDLSQNASFCGFQSFQQFLPGRFFIEFLLVDRIHYLKFPYPANDAGVAERTS